MNRPFRALLLHSRFIACLFRLPTCYIVAVALIAWSALPSQAEERPYSRLATPGADGKLTYPPYTESGDHLPDFSWCGYRGGGVALPRLPVAVTLEAVAEGDDHERIQKALDEVGDMPVDANGFRGAVLLKRGTYRVANMLTMDKSGVVLRGEGDGKDGTVMIATAKKKHIFLLIRGGGKEDVPEEQANTKQEILADYVPVGSRIFTVKDTSGYKVGDNLMLCREANQAWINEIGMEKTGTWKPYTMKFQRVVTAVTTNTVTVDAPLVNSIDRKWGGGYLVRCEYPNRIEHVGVEGIRCESVYSSPTDHAHAWRFIEIHNAQNVWVRDCTALHMAYSAVTINATAKWVTVQDTKCLEMISEIKGGLRYPFCVIGQLCLVQRCVASEGRHDFVMQYWVPGPNVFLDCVSINPHSDSGPHQRWATGTLYDNVETRTLNVVNRGSSGSGHGWAGAQFLFWNCKADSMSVQSPPTAHNFAIGCIVKNPKGDGFRESENVPVVPRSLYLHQLEERLGPQAVKNIQR